MNFVSGKNNNHYLVFGEVRFWLNTESGTMKVRIDETGELFPVTKDSALYRGMKKHFDQFLNQ
ncbi:MULTISPECIES: hypothetical protein [Allobacillus]|uniref:Uncharacterized protein n=1 Tax=Allobacillus salarius TaxID=1955272 RepID=A0A556P8P7_9BACI|nr:hypothetical protein [Allobacillus salarius]TSJ60761.1 hypothetical protein FPQ13_11675 [Allobacillus salarius]